jgi:hypothetical protein
MEHVIEDPVGALSLVGATIFLWALYWAVWTGRLRWLNDSVFGPYALTLLPATAAAFTVAWFVVLLDQMWPIFVAFAIFLIGLGLHVATIWWDATCLQPGWFREERQEGAVDTRGRGAELTAAVARRPDPPAALGPLRWEQGAVLVTDDTTRPAAIAMRHGRVGRLFVGELGVAFVQADSETILRGPAEPLTITWPELADLAPARLRSGPAAWAGALRGDPRGRPLLALHTTTGTHHLQLPRITTAIDHIDAARRGAGASA